LEVARYVKDEKATKSLVYDLGEELSFIQGENLVVMSTSMIATILLMHRKGISMDTLIKRVAWVYDELKARKSEVGLTAAPSSQTVQQSLSFLSDFVNRTRDIF
jgi:hypothetical protein